ncbi:MAG: amidohydrolase family protein, partial [Planctomycetes bacterium]|nr:amidohydrolase family protein [Planctomycetota bacterium]
MKGVKRFGLIAAMSIIGVGVNAAPTADAIYTGGPIITMNDAQPKAEALAVKDGKILALGSRAEIEKAHKDAKTTMVDLGGRTLAPGFVDGHAHFLSFGTQAVGANLLAPPDGNVNNIDDIVAKLKQFAAGPDVGKTGWIYGMGYDDSLLGRHPTRADLDKVSTSVPVIAVHISGHFSAMNSAGLKAVGIGPDTPNPEGGVIRREADGKTPNGVLEELASIPHMIKAINPTAAADQDYFLKKGLEAAKSYGYTSATEGRLMGSQHAALKSAADRGLLDIDVTGWADYTVRKDLDADFSKDYKGHYRLAGLKITLDGAPQGRTAWCTLPYLLPPDGQKADYKGYPAIPDTKEVAAYVDEAYAKGWPVKVHTNGDAAIDQLFFALKPAVARHGVKPGQVILIHGQLIRSDQVKKLKPLG